MKEQIRKLQLNFLDKMLSPEAFFVLSFGGGIFLFAGAGLWERLCWEPNLLAAGELLLVCLFLSGIGWMVHHNKLSEKRRVLLILAAVIAEVYLHCLLLPFLISGLYFAVLAFITVCLAGWYRKGQRKALRKHLRKWKEENSGQIQYGMDCLSCMLPFLLIQLNRMNIAWDYDSIRYGLRSRYVLTGGSFFDALGQVNTVYTYPKGLEVLTLPLSYLPGFSFVSCFQFWVLTACLILTAMIVYRISRNIRRAFQSMVLMSAVCGISNMAVTAKTDLITLLVQLIMLWCFMKGNWMNGTAAAVLSLAFKPTALVFTSVAWLCLAGYQLYHSGDAIRKGKLHERQSGNLLIAAVLFTGILWYRTWRITGMPATSVFTSVWELLGFSAKWPYCFSAIPSEGISLGLWGGFCKLIGRMFLFLFCPVGADMEHVLMAWGGFMIPVLLGLSIRNAVRCRQRTDQKQRSIFCQIYLLYAAVTAVSLLSLYLLWQIDGNYYMLWYTLTIITAVGFLPEQLPDIGRIRRVSGVLLLSSLPVMLLTGWAGAVGFTPIRLYNTGWYDQREELQQYEREHGSEAIWSELSSDPENRVIAFAPAPSCYFFQCNVQSYTDIEGSGGNVRLVKTLNSFKEFLCWAETDYIYFETDYLHHPQQKRAAELVHDLIQDGTLTELYAEPAKAAPGEQPKRICVYGKVNRKRAAEPWQVPLEKKEAERAEDMLQTYRILMEQSAPQEKSGEGETE